MEEVGSSQFLPDSCPSRVLECVEASAEEKIPSHDMYTCHMTSGDITMCVCVSLEEVEEVEQLSEVGSGRVLVVAKAMRWLGVDAVIPPVTQDTCDGVRV